VKAKKEQAKGNHTLKSRTDWGHTVNKGAIDLSGVACQGKNQSPLEKNRIERRVQPPGVDRNRGRSKSKKRKTCPDKRK